MKRRTRYMHLLDSRPAHYNGEQIVVAGREVRSVASLAGIRQQQRASIAFRTSRGYHDSSHYYGYMRVRF